jgi:hypothetical protein
MVLEEDKESSEGKKAIEDRMRKKWTRRKF